MNLHCLDRRLVSSGCEDASANEAMHTNPAGLACAPMEYLNHFVKTEILRDFDNDPRLSSAAAPYEGCSWDGKNEPVFDCSGNHSNNDTVKYDHDECASSAMVLQSDQEGDRHWDLLEPNRYVEMLTVFYVSLDETRTRSHRQRPCVSYPLL